MIRRIILENFMSHRHTVIEPANGLTVLVGENNCGKSAVVAALQILCNNASGDYMVRHGQKECKVIVETDEGHVVEWSRSNGTVSYVLDGQPVHRLRGGIPDDLHKFLRIPQVDSQGSGEAFDIHFGEQKKPIFLLDASGGQAAKFFASSSDAEALIKMQILHRDNIRDASQRNTRLQERLRITESRLQPLDAVEGIQERLDELERQYDSLELLRVRIENLEQSTQVLEHLVDDAILLQAKETVVTGLRTPPSMRDADSLSELTESLENWLLRSRYLESLETALLTMLHPPKLTDTMTLEMLTLDVAQMDEEVRQKVELDLLLSGLSDVPRLMPTQALETIFEEIRSIVDEVGNRQSSVDCLVRLEPPPDLFDLGSLLNNISDLERVQDEALRCGEKIAELSKCTVPPEMSNESLLADLVEKLENAEAGVMENALVCKTFDRLIQPPVLVNTSSLASLVLEGELAQHHANTIQARFEQITSATLEAEMAVRNWVERNPICPICGAEFDPVRLISMTAPASGGHVHA